MRTAKSYRTGRRTTQYSRATGYQRTTRSKTTAGWAYNPSQFNDVRTEIQWRICSYRNIHTQFQGPGKVTWFSPTTANRWVKYVNTGARIYKFTNTDFCRHFGYQWHDRTPTAAYRWLRQKYGAGIWDVTRGRGNCWLVAATPNVTARPFSNYNWR